MMNIIQLNIEARTTHLPNEKFKNLFILCIYCLFIVNIPKTIIYNTSISGSKSNICIGAITSSGSTLTGKRTIHILDDIRSAALNNSEVDIHFHM